MNSVQITILTIFATSIYFISGCSTAESEYATATKTNSIQAYQSFLSRYPTSEYTDSTKQRIAKLQAEEQQRIAELQAQEKVEQRIQSNWKNLSTGMTEKQVEELLGKLDSKVWSWRINIHGSENFQTGEVGPTTLTTIFTHGRYTLKYLDGKLTDWSPR